MENRRRQELKFLIRTETPVLVVEERDAKFDEDIYEDFYTLRELVAEDYLEYIGHNKNYFFLRPRCKFSVSLGEEIRSLEAGEIIKLYLTEKGKTDFVSWINQAQ